MFISKTESIRERLAAEARTILQNFKVDAVYNLTPWNMPGQLDPTLIPSIRVGCVVLAKWLKSVGGEDEIVLWWLKQGEEDPLPEVRRSLQANEE